MQHFGAFVVGIVIGFLGGLFGKGGSAIATPLLAIIGFPGFIAVASPLPSTIPGTLLASGQYWKHRLIDWQVFGWSVAVGIPATILGSALTKYTGIASLIDPDRHSSIWIRCLLFDLAGREKIRRLFAAGGTAIPAAVLAGPARADRGGGRIHFGIAGERRGIPACARIYSLTKITN